MAKKEPMIKLKLTKEQRDLFNMAAQESGVTVSEFIIACTEDVAKRKLENVKNRNELENRINETEEKLKGLRRTLELRKNRSKSFEELVLKFK